MIDTNRFANSDHIKIIFQCRDQIEERAGFDVLDNQNYNTMLLAAHMEMADPTFELLTERSGADYVVVDNGSLIEGEMKATKSEPSSKARKSWAFHAYAILSNPPERMFLFYTHARGEPQRIYDIRCPTKVKAINEHLTAAASKWVEDVHSGKKNGKNDMVAVPEKLVEQLFVDAGNTVHRLEGNIFKPTEQANLFGEGTLLFSDLVGRSWLFGGDLQEDCLLHRAATRCDNTIQHGNNFTILTAR